jgi:hypothetical protein
MIFDRGPYAANAPSGRPGSRRSIWVWGIGSLAVVVVLLAVLAWVMREEPVRGGTAAPTEAPATVVPPADRATQP